MVGAFFMSGEICFFLCPFLRKEVLLGGEKRHTYNKQRVQGKSYLLEQHLDGDISNAYLAVNLRSIKAAKTAD